MFEWTLLKDTTARNQKLEPEEILTYVYESGSVLDDRAGIIWSVIGVLSRCARPLTAQM